MSVYGSIGFTRRGKEPQVKVDKKAEQEIKSKIKALQNKRSELYNDDNITDEQLESLERELNSEINQLIESMY